MGCEQYSYHVLKVARLSGYRSATDREVLLEMKDSVASLQAECAFESNLSLASDCWTTDAVYYPSLETQVVVAKGQISEVFIRRGAEEADGNVVRQTGRAGPIPVTGRVNESRLSTNDQASLRTPGWGQPRSKMFLLYCSHQFLGMCCSSGKVLSLGSLDVRHSSPRARIHV